MTAKFVLYSKKIFKSVQNASNRPVFNAFYLTVRKNTRRTRMPRLKTNTNVPCAMNLQYSNQCMLSWISFWINSDLSVLPAFAQWLMRLLKATRLEVSVIKCLEMKKRMSWCLYINLMLVRMRTSSKVYTYFREIPNLFMNMSSKLNNY